MNNNILIVDDNIDLNDGLAVILQDEGYRVSTAYNGNDAINLFKKETYDCVLLDIRLPDISGFDVFKEMHTLNPKTRIIVMTGYRFEQMIKEVTKSEHILTYYNPSDVNKILDDFNTTSESIAVVFSDKGNISDQIQKQLNEQGKKSCILTSSDEVNKQNTCDCNFFILNMKHPVLCSMAAYLQLDSNNSSPSTIIVVNHPESIDSRAALRSSSITDCLFKPFHPEDAIKAIKKAA